MFKHYGLTGETVTLKPKHGESDAYPWGYAPQKAKITAEVKAALPMIKFVAC